MYDGKVLAGDFSKNRSKVHSVLIKIAKTARLRAYAPHSRFRVGSALLTKSGKIYTGCNIENVSFGLTNCAERTAIFKAVSEGERKFVAMATVTEGEEPALSCGACRQVILEFGDNIDLVYANLKGKLIIKRSGELLPDAFRTFSTDKSYKM